MDEIRIGVVADTHGLMRPEILRALHGSHLIVHAGDIGTREVLESLRAVAPVVAVRGNVDRGAWASDLKRIEVIEAGEVLLYVLHDINEVDLDPRVAGFAAVISGHSHRPAETWRSGVLFLNPGSAGPRRFKLPVSFASLRVKGKSLEATITVVESKRGSGTI
jgi:uncharacterized protein